MKTKQAVKKTDAILNMFTDVTIVDLFTLSDNLCIAFAVQHTQSNLNLYYKTIKLFDCKIENNNLYFTDYRTNRNYKLMYKA